MLMNLSRLIAFGCGYLAITTFSPAQQDRWNELTAQVNQLYTAGKAADAIPVAKQAVAVAKSTFGTDHVNYGLSLNNLAFAYATVGQYSEAGPLFTKSIAVFE